MFPSPHGVISISTDYFTCIEPSTSVSVPSRGYLYIYGRIRRVARSIGLFPSPHGVISISTRFTNVIADDFEIVSVPSRGYLYIYTIPPFPLKTWPKVPLCGAKRHFRNFHSARQSFFFISPGNMPCGAKLPFYYFNSAHSHIIQLPSVSRTFAYMRRQS